MLQCCIYYECKFIAVEFSKMIHLEILSEEFYADTLSDCLSGIYTNVSEDDSSSEYSSDSDNVNIRQTKRQKKKTPSDKF